jgi:hypothetical protein
MTTLEQFDIRNFSDRLTPKKGKHRYVCPVCEGSLTIDPKSGKYHCWGQECASAEIREAIRPLAEVIGGTVPRLPYINKKFRGVEQPKKLPTPAPIPQGKIALATLPHPVSKPARVSIGRNFEITYPYSPNQWVLRIEKPDGSKITIPHHRRTDVEGEAREQGDLSKGETSNGDSTPPSLEMKAGGSLAEAGGKNLEGDSDPHFRSATESEISVGDSNPCSLPPSPCLFGEVVKGKGEQTWHPYRIEEIRSFGAGKWVLGNEGEKCVDITRSVLQLVSFTFQGGSWSEESLAIGLQEIKDCGVVGVVYFPDNDKPGRKKAQNLAQAAAKVQLPFLVIDPLRLWPHCPSGGDIADWVAEVRPSNELRKEGRGQEAEGRREEFERGFNPAQFLAIKSEIMVGDSDPCSLWSQQGEGVISPSQELPSPCLFVEALNTEIELCKNTIVLAEEVSQQPKEIAQKDWRLEYEDKRQLRAKFNLTRTAQISIKNGFLPSIQLESIPNGIIGLKGDWGIGKSFLLSAWCQQWQHRIIQVAHLNALLSNTAPKFDCFHHHELKDLQLGVTSAKRLSITDVSLAAMFDPEKWTKGEPFILIIDEIEQVLKSIQTNSNLKGTLRVKARVKIEWLVKNADYVIGSDRDLCDETLNYIEQVRGDNRKAFIIQHTGKKGVNRQPIVLNQNKHKDEILTRLINDAKIGKKIIIPCENKTDLLAIELLLSQAEISDKSMFFAHGDNSNEPGIKELIQKADQIYTNYQILGYTMTMGTALSFEKQHFEKCYAFFSGDVLSATDQAQMLFRYRPECDLTVWVSPRQRRLEIEPDNLLSNLVKKVQETDKLIASIDQIGELIEQGILLTAKGEISLDDMPWIQHKLSIIARANASRANPSQSLHDLLIDAGFTLKIECNDQEQPVTTVEGNTHTEQKKELKAAKDKAIAEAELMNEAEFLRAIISSGNLKKSERDRLEKTRLHRDTGLEITQEIVELQRTKKLTRGAKMLKVLLGDKQTAVAYDLTDREHNPDVGDQSFYTTKRRLLCELGIPEIIEKLAQGWSYTNDSFDVVAVADKARERRADIKRLLGFTVSLEKNSKDSFQVSNCAIVGLILDTLCIERESSKNRKQGKVYRLNRQHWEMMKGIMGHMDKQIHMPTLAGVIEKAWASAASLDGVPHPKALTESKTAPIKETLETHSQSVLEGVPHPNGTSYIYKNHEGVEHKPENCAIKDNQPTRWTGLKLKLQQGLEDAGKFYSDLVSRIGDAVGIVGSEPIWNQYLSQWMVPVNFANGCKSVVCDWLVGEQCSNSEVIALSDLILLEQ